MSTTHHRDTAAGPARGPRGPRDGRSSRGSRGFEIVLIAAYGIFAISATARSSVQIGRDCVVGSNVSVGFALIGDRVKLYAGARIGEAGFGATGTAAGVMDIPQLGRVILQDGVTVGANSCIDRGAYDDTVIGENTKIDNLVMVGHNCVIGRNCLLVANTGISGSVTVGDNVIFGGKAGVGDHITIGEGARVERGCLVGDGVTLGRGARLGAFERVSRRRGSTEDEESDEEWEEVEKSTSCCARPTMKCIRTDVVAVRRPG